MFALLAEPAYADMALYVSCFEIYGGKLFDLLNARKGLVTREDGRRRICIVGLKEYEVTIHLQKTLLSFPPPSLPRNLQSHALQAVIDLSWVDMVGPSQPRPPPT